MNIGFSDITKSYGEKLIARHFTLPIEASAVTCLMGPSGCGKTTLLNLFAGLTPIDNGTVMGNTDKRIAYIFQEPRLIPFLTVRQNIELVMKPPDAEKIAELLSALELSDTANLYPPELSGGMQQRVSVARALAYEPDIILADEPASGLDIVLKHTLYGLLKSYCTTHGATMLMVTHEPEDCVRYADEAIVLCGPPLNVLLRTTIRKNNADAQAKEITATLQQCANLKASEETER